MSIYILVYTSNLVSWVSFIFFTFLVGGPLSGVGDDCRSYLSVVVSVIGCRLSSAVDYQVSLSVVVVGSWLSCVGCRWSGVGCRLSVSVVRGQVLVVDCLCRLSVVRCWL
jgi:hypothetical protein